jgi:hypothetical protein
MQFSFKYTVKGMERITDLWEQLTMQAGNVKIPPFFQLSHIQTKEPHT